MNLAVDAASLKRLMEALEEALAETDQFLARVGNEPAQDSTAALELASFPKRGLVLTAYSQADMLLEVGSELVTCFIRTCAEPALPIASWSSVRGVIEPCALATWLLDPSINVRTRVKRSFALRFEGLDQQVKMMRAAHRVENIEAISRRVDEVEQEAISLGYEAITNRDGQRTGIGQVMPSITSIVGETLDEEVAYRILSAVTHAHHWAVRRLNFDILPMDDPAINPSAIAPGLRALKKAAKPGCFVYLADQAMKAFTRPVLCKTKLFGGDYGLLGARIKFHNQRVTELSKAVGFVPEREKSG
ncbi:MAG TPA: hypothetical protein VOA87_13410 [Thermoanaerobaculia bacterium]|nr:hypothetical protein [Thermoanaerobaculia bacterium]